MRRYSVCMVGLHAAQDIKLVLRCSLSVPHYNQNQMPVLVMAPNRDAHRHARVHPRLRQRVSDRRNDRQALRRTRFSTRLPSLSLVAAGGRVQGMAARHHATARRQERTDRCDPVLRGAARHPDRQCHDAILSGVRRSFRRAVGAGDAGARRPGRD
jgi:hypothetical protein